MIFDTHCHYTFSHYQKGDLLAKVLQDDQKDGVEGYLQVGCDEVSTFSAIQMANKYENMYASVGIHPCDVGKELQPREHAFYENKLSEKYQPQAKNEEEVMEIFADWIKQHKKVRAVGETGIDQYHESSNELLELQLTSTRRHISLANGFDLPVIFHIRGAWAHFLQFLSDEFTEKTKAVAHCFDKSPEIAEKCLKKGLYLGFGALILDEKNTGIQETIKMTPIEKILTETDAPFLLPRSRRKETKLNRSGYIKDVISHIANVKNLPADVVERQLYENAKGFYAV